MRLVHTTHTHYRKCSKMIGIMFHLYFVAATTTYACTHNNSPFCLFTHIDKEGEPPHYEPLLDHVDHDFVMKLEMLSNPNFADLKPNQHKSLYKTNRKSTKSNMQPATTPTGPAKSSKKTGSKNKITT